MKPWETTNSTLDELQDLSGELLAALARVLDRSSIVKYPAEPDSTVAILRATPFHWMELPREAQRDVGKARQLIDKWEELAGRAIAASAPNRRGAFDQHSTIMRDIVDQEDGAGAPGSSIGEMRERLGDAVKAQVELVLNLPSAQAQGDGYLLVVPDTNALIWQPAFEKWKMPDGTTIVVVPQVIRELDERKLRGDGAGAAASSVIRRLKEYGRRGDTSEGVKLRPGVKLREVAFYADMSRAPQMLQPGHADDEFLASVLELKWSALTARAVIVTRDRNMQNKARGLRVSCADAEEIADGRADRQSRRGTDDRQIENSARDRLRKGLPYIREQLEVPPQSRATNPQRQSWTLLASPLSLPADFAERVLRGPSGIDDPMARLPFEQLPPPFDRPPTADVGQCGFARSRKVGVPTSGYVRFAADAGGLIGIRRYREVEPDARRSFLLRDDVEEGTLRPMLKACVDALSSFSVTGRALLEVWILGVSDSQVLTVGHPTLGDQRDGWIKDGLLHISGEINLPASDPRVDDVIATWGRAFARAAGIQAWEPVAA
jgi:hypothetical protein